MEVMMTMTSQSTRSRLSMISNHYINLISRNHCAISHWGNGRLETLDTIDDNGVYGSECCSLLWNSPLHGLSLQDHLRNVALPHAGGQLASRTSWFRGGVSNQNWANQSPSLVFATGRMSLIELWQLLPALLPTFGKMQVYSKHGAGTQRETEARLGSCQALGPWAWGTEILLQP